VVWVLYRYCGVKMEEFINKLDLTIDPNKLRSDIEYILDLYPWIKHNQIGLRHRPGENPWTDAHGSLIDKTTGIRRAFEKDFTEWNPLIPVYLKSCLEKLKDQYSIELGRIRIMRLLPNRGLSVHNDDEVRFHLVLKTNLKSYFFEVNDNVPVGHHIPADSHFYKIDTRRTHFVYNGGDDERIHLVVCPA